MVNLLAFAGISFIEKIKAVLHISIHTVFPIACKRDHAGLPYFIPL